MVAKNGINQTYARVINNHLVLDRLREKSMSATLLAEELNLSNASASSILKELCQAKIIKETQGVSNQKVGRRQVYYAINENYCLIVMISLSGRQSRIVISNIKEEIVLELKKEIKKYDLSTMYEIILETKKLIETSSYRDIPVKSLVISVPGRVNKITGELQLSKQFDPDLFVEKNAIIHLFEKYFECPITLNNDISLECYGEQARGELIDIENGLLVHIDEGMGSSFVFSGKQYRGELGYAGEIGLLRNTFNGKEDYLDEFSSLRALKKACGVSNTKELVERYQKEKEVQNYVDSTARLIGEKLRGVQELLNVSKIIISGRVVCFGETYLNAIKQEVNKAYGDCEVVFSSLDKDSIVYGGIHKAVNRLMDENSELCNHKTNTVKE